MKTSHILWIFSSLAVLGMVGGGAVIDTLIRQLVHNHDNQKEFPVCYNLYLPTDDKILLYQDGKVFFKILDCIQVEGLQIDWQSSGTWIFQNGILLIELKDEVLYVDYVTPTRSLSIILIRQSTRIGKYLNIYIDNVDRKVYMDEFTYGLFGEVAKRKFEFFEPVQIGESRAAVKINNMPYQAIIVNHRGFKCWLLRASDVLYPDTMIDFIYH
ncbi:DgyrCDS12883 [Dimorphilus gyrociliatus]|uniref:DgyrCDS12883 n=1 Tax=Dimorphilus gyrociliatus TaxID=2664684 RepID=A0A7I8W926_9ANNE|nr:DgyrCDS12883 [Dimorphilus gyrociliatus]